MTSNGLLWSLYNNLAFVFVRTGPYCLDFLARVEKIVGDISRVSLSGYCHLYVQNRVRSLYFLRPNYLPEYNVWGRLQLSVESEMSKEYSAKKYT